MVVLMKRYSIRDEKKNGKMIIHFSTHFFQYNETNIVCSIYNEIIEQCAVDMVKSNTYTHARQNIIFTSVVITQKCYV